MSQQMQPMPPELVRIQATLNEIETQRNMANSRCAEMAGELALLSQRAQELEQLAKAQAAELDTLRPKEPAELPHVEPAMLSPGQ